MPLTIFNGEKNTYELLFQYIDEGTLQPGERLTEISLAERLQVSRTPVREAIKALEVEGLVEHVPRVGVCIKKLTYQEVFELYQYRSEVEIIAAKLAANNASDLELQELSGIHEKMESKNTPPMELKELNKLFHQCIFNSTKNRYLIQSLNMVRKMLMLVGKTAFHIASRHDEVRSEHAKILEALISHNPVLASLAMAEHIQASAKIRFHLFSGNNSRS